MTTSAVCSYMKPTMGCFKLIGYVFDLERHCVAHTMRLVDTGFGGRHMRVLDFGDERHDSSWGRDRGLREDPSTCMNMTRCFVAIGLLSRGGGRE